MRLNYFPAAQALCSISVSMLHGSMLTRCPPVEIMQFKSLDCAQFSLLVCSRVRPCCCMPSLVPIVPTSVRWEVGSTFQWQSLTSSAYGAEATSILLQQMTPTLRHCVNVIRMGNPHRRCGRMNGKEMRSMELHLRYEQQSSSSLLKRANLKVVCDRIAVEACDTLLSSFRACRKCWGRRPSWCTVLLGCRVTRITPCVDSSDFF